MGTLATPAPGFASGEGSLNVLQIVSGHEINGAVVYCKLLTQQLAARGHRVWLACRPDSWLTHQDLDCEIIETQMGRSRRQLKEIATLVREHQIDVVHTHMSRAHAFGTLLKLLVSVPVIKTAHSRSFQLHWQINDCVIANSLATADYHRKTNRIPKQKIETIHCFIDSEKSSQVTPKSKRIVRRQLRWNNEEYLLGIVGQVIVRKGHRYLLEALPRLVQEIPNLRLVIVGRFHRDQTYVKQLRRYLNANQLHRVTKWIGIRENVPDFLAAMDVCVVPSLEEPLGLVAIESQSVGTPVVASETGGLSEVVKHETTGLLVPPRDSDAIADAVLRIHQDEALKRKLIYRGKKQYEEKFSTEQLVRQIEDVYQRQIQARRSAA